MSSLIPHDYRYKISSPTPVDKEPEKKAITTQKVSRWLLFPGSHILFIKDVLGIFYFKIPLYM